jgi:hypothetical protein
MIKKLLILVFSMVLLNTNAQVLTRGPYLQKGSKTSITIRWRTDVNSKSKVTLGTTYGVYTIALSDNTLVTEHIMNVSGLQPDTRYYYTIETDAIKLQGDANNFFTTAPTDTTTQKMSFATFGDCGRDENSFRTNSLLQYQNYLQSIGKSAADLMLLLGDNAYVNGVDTEYRDQFFAAYQSNILKNHVVFPAPGNHEYANDFLRQSDHAIDYYNIFSIPDSGQCGGVPSYNKAYYSFDWGNIHFMSFDSYGLEDGGTSRLYDTNGKQALWIKADLAANTKKWTIAYWHHPPYTMGTHNSDNEGELIALRQRFIQILERNGVDMILCGHSHVYERSYLLKGYFSDESSFNKATHTTDSSSAMYDGSVNSCPYIYKSGKINHGSIYVVSGSSGASGTMQSSFPHNATPFAFNDGGMFYFEVQENRLDAKFIRQDGVIADKFTIIKDANRKDTLTIKPGNSIDIKASWIGNYIWNTTATTKTINVTPTATTLYVVKDDASNTCITDSIIIKLGFPAEITSTKYDAIKLYPVPANEIMNVNIPSAIGAAVKTTIVSTTGQTLLNEVLHTDNSGNMNVNTSQLPKNTQLYLHLDYSGHTQHIPFIIQ